MNAANSGFQLTKTKTLQLDKLISAETLDEGKLREAARRKSDEKILIQEKDCAAPGRTYRLKERLIEKFPQLVFHTPKKRNKSEVEDLSKGSVVESYLEETETPMTETDDDSQREDFEIQRPSNNFKEKNASLREIYFAALTLRESVIKKPTKWCDQWPQLSSDMSRNEAGKVVPPLLFNFVAWMLGFSKDPEESAFVDVDKDGSPKLFSVCKDLIYIASRGNFQTPKSLVLATAVSQISGCSS
eukprot:gene18496-20348_t